MPGGAVAAGGSLELAIFAPKARKALSPREAGAIT